MTEKPIQLGLAGLGTVGSGVYETLCRNHALLEARSKIPFRLKRIAVRNLEKPRETVVPRELLTDDWQDLVNDPEIDIVLMDSPGSLKAEGLVPMFVNSDIIVVPFHYDLMTVPSTASFLLFIDRLKKAVDGRMKSRLFIIPNLNDGRVGKRAELVLWDNARETFSNYGYVTAKIPKRADMERFSTMAALDMQASIVTPVFEKIYAEIFDTTKPIKEVQLTGIQLAENLNPKPKKQESSNNK